MRGYWAIFSARFRMLLQYRAAALAGFGTQMFWGLIRMMIFAGFYASAVGPQPMTLEQVVAYVWLGQAFLGLFPFRADAEVAAMIQSGAVAYELLRPRRLYAMWFARSIAARTAPTLLRCIPQLAFATALGWLRWEHPWGVAACAASLSGAVCIAAGVTVLMNVSMFWTISGSGVNAMLSSTIFLCSGMIVPIPLMPEPLQRFVEVLPFRAMCDAPFRLFTGSLPASAVWGLLAHAAAWTVGLVALGQVWLALAMRRVTVQGG